MLSGFIDPEYLFFIDSLTKRSLIVISIVKSLIEHSLVRIIRIVIIGSLIKRSLIGISIVKSLIEHSLVRIIRIVIIGSLIEQSLVIVVVKYLIQQCPVE